MSSDSWSSKVFIPKVSKAALTTWAVITMFKKSSQELKQCLGIFPTFYLVNKIPHLVESAIYAHLQNRCHRNISKASYTYQMMFYTIKSATYACAVLHEYSFCVGFQFLVATQVFSYLIVMAKYIVITIWRN